MPPYHGPTQLLNVSPSFPPFLRRVPMSPSSFPLFFSSREQGNKGTREQGNKGTSFPVVEKGSLSQQLGAPFSFSGPYKWRRFLFESKPRGQTSGCREAFKRYAVSWPGGTCWTGKYHTPIQLSRLERTLSRSIRTYIQVCETCGEQLQ